MLINKKEEIERIGAVASWFSTKKGFDGKILKYTAKALLPFCKGPRILELGCADGSMTETLVDNFMDVVAVDGSESLIEVAKKNIKGNVTFCCALFEEFEPQGTFNTIIMTHVLEHVIDPVLLLSRAKKWLEENGTILICVPNATSLHRKIGKSMGLINELADLSETDVKVGHRRIYSIDTLKKDIQKANLTIETWGGIFLKPRPNSIMESWDDNVLDALYEAGIELPTYCSEIYVVCTHPRNLGWSNYGN